MSHVSLNSTTEPTLDGKCPAWRATNLLPPMPMPTRFKLPYEVDHESTKPMVKSEVLYAPLENPNCVPSVHEKIVFWRKINATDPLYVASSSEIVFPNDPEIAGLSKAESLEQDPGRSKEETEEILDILFPQKEWVDEQKNVLLRAKVSAEMPVREESIYLKRIFESKLKMAGITHKGLSHLRTFIHFGAFDELIREVTINSAERGLLLHRVKEEILLTLGLYTSAVEGAIELGKKKCCEIEESQVELLKERDDVLCERDEAADVAFKLNLKLRDLTRIQHEQKQLQEKQQFIQLQTLKRSNHQLSQQYEDIRVYADLNRMIAEKEKAAERKKTMAEAKKNPLIVKFDAIFKNI